MNDRDTFAAAALTGLLAGPGDKDFSMDYWARHAYEAADAMLRERDRTSVGVPDTGSGAGSTPVAQQPSRGIRAGLCQPFDSARTTCDAQPGAKAEPSERKTRREGQGTGDICERLRGWFKAVDAVPATDLMDEAADEIERLRNGALSTCETVQQEPVAWAVIAPNYSYVSLFRDCADAAADEEGGHLVPLYRSPTLTADEREAVEWYAGYGQGEHSATLRSLLERLE